MIVELGSASMDVDDDDKDKGDSDTIETIINSNNGFVCIEYWN